MKRRILEPIERVSEVLFGLIMVLTFTGSLSAAEAGHADVRSMLIAALGCNLAWGIIDGVMYLMSCLAEQGHELATLRTLRAATDVQAARQALASALPAFVAPVARPEELDALAERLKAQAEPGSPTLGRYELLGALSVLLWVFVTTFPVALPFLFVSEPARALRLSNAVALGLLYLTGHALGRITGHSRWLTGLVMVALGAILVALTIALGG